MAVLKSARFWMGSLLVCTWATAAQAENLCEKNEDCPSGFNCTTTAGTTTPECAVPPCEAGKECPTPPECKPPTEWKQCTPASCETDADCGGGAVCHALTFSECSGGAAVACAPNEMCPMPEPAPEPACTEHTIKECLARYLLPCQQDTDCGDGFNCLAGEECMCAGSAGSADAAPRPQSGMDQGSGFAPVPPAEDAGVAKGDAAVSGKDPSCECHPTELKQCELKEMSCRADGDCPSDFVCVSVSGDNAVSCAVPRDAKGDAAVCEPTKTLVAEQKHCAPRGGLAAPGSVGTRGHDDASSGTGEGGQTTSAPKDSNSVDAGINPDLPNAGETAAPSNEPAACSVSAPRAAGLHAWLVPFGFALVALGLRSRRKPR